MAHISVKVKTKDLKPGQILAEDVRDLYGRALLFQGVVLTSNLILGLRSRDYIDSVKILIPIEEAPDGLIKPEEGGIAIPGGIHQKIGRFFENARKVHELRPETIKNLTEDVRPVIEEIFETKPAIMDSLQLISSHDNHTHHHSWMVMLLALSILRTAELNNILRPDRQDRLDMALGGLLHDVGKTKIPLEILNKPGKLTPEEWKIMKKHPDYGYAMVKPTENLMPLSKAAVAHHHRFLDGTGYSPDGIPPLERLPVLVRIITLADVYEAIVSDRPYHVAALPYHAIKIIGEGGGRKFDERFIDCLREMVAPFPTVTDGINASELQAFWQEASPSVYFDRLILGQSSNKAIESLWGKPAGTVEVHADADLLNLAWNTPGTWAIIPFEEIQPRWKVIALDEQSPLHKDFMPESYPLRVPISLVAVDGKPTDAIAESLKPNLAQTNREAEKLTTVILTGVTALVRGTAREMEKLGITRPAEVIGPTLREADVLHISNEVPFAVNCGEPAPQNIDKLIFCSKDEYVELLKAVGTDVVELTGDHFEDWGPEAMLHTLELYKELGWFYYGGGRNLEEAKKPVKLEVNGTKLAFLGCNAKEWTYSNATEDKPGNLRCDWDYMSAEVEKLNGEGYLPIVTFQHNEYYVWEAQSQLVEDFHRMEAAGAVIVSGSQAHQPHAIEITDNAMLHYGLGNLFFDQYGLTQDTDDAFIDRHVFYDGKYLGVELLTITFKDFSQPLWMDPAARAVMLEKLFSVSIWNMPAQ